MHITALDITGLGTTPFGLSAEQTAAVLTAAGRAPSLHNSQPWAFRLTADSIEMHVDRARLLPVTDPDGRQARLGCGAALFNMRLALARQGVPVTVSVGADTGADSGRGPLAVVERGGHFVLTPERAELERAIAHRRTNRQPFFESTVPASHQLILARAAEAELCTLATITDPGRLAHLRQWAASAHRTQQSDPAWVAEFSAWVRRDHGPDGVPISAAGPAPGTRDPWTLRDFGRPDRPGRSEGKEFEEQPLIAVLGTHSDVPQSQVQAGQAMERVLLAATNLGLAASFLSQLIEVEPVRRQVSALLGGRICPQAVLRIGFGGPVPTTPRRTVLDVLMGPPVPLA